jgi:renalase
MKIDRARSAYDSTGSSMMRTAVVGAGIAGLACTRALVEEGHEVTVYEAGAHPAGRIASHRDTRTGLVADHGARYFAARFERFLRQAEAWVDEGVAARWTPRSVALNDAGAPEPQRAGPVRFVGTPTMDAPVRALAARLADRADIRYDTPVRSIHLASGDWVVTDREGVSETFDAVATAIPAPQAVHLLTEVAHLHTAAACVPMAPCWSLAVRFPGRLPLGYDAAG